MTRDEHLQWCKDRAMEYINSGDIMNGITSMLSDLEKHEDTAVISKAMFPLAMLEMMNPSKDGATRFIQGFN